MGDVGREMVSCPIVPRSNRAEKAAWILNFW